MDVSGFPYDDFTSGQGEDVQARDAAVARLAAFPYGFGDPTVSPLCRLLPSHQQAVAGRFAPEQDSADPATLPDLAASFLRGSGDASTALPLSRRAADGLERRLGPDHPDTRIVKANHEQALREAGERPSRFRRMLGRLTARRSRPA
ncbi:hypothetical protein [Rhodopila globiformis]|uniref:Tetratricopeptide repeat protein n=1 Tax=Rhodopila globiformis TaxID=1071 RepID=A0A2S6NJM8_RHOGL|nr:hypothetical protein [Rhodopila globiformis]PPQ35106.1 hypothetical protein CCS01_08620 [Rhodopila globiformis]